jgi:ribosomal protein S18 acetylase RimI-like enzyme
MQQPLPHIDPLTIAATIEASVNAEYLSLARLPGAILHSGPDCAWVDSGLAGATLNVVVRIRFHPDQAGSQIEGVLSHFRSRSLPVGWHIGPSSEPADLAQLLVAHELTHHESEPGMAIAIDQMHEEYAPEGLTIEQVQDAGGLADWVGVWLFPVPEDIRRRHLDVLLQLGLGDTVPWRYYLGRLHGHPVATAKLFVGEGVAAVHTVTTLPEVRRRGIGSAMTRHVLHEARALGYRVGVLTASPEGIGSYRRIGFRECGWFHEYRWEP